MSEFNVDEMLARLEGLGVEAITRLKVCIVGAGSVGSYIAEHLVRSGVQSLIVFDHDTVSAANLSRSSFLARHVGGQKVEALQDVCESINPHVTFTGVAKKLEEIPRNEAKELFSSVSIFVACTDDPATQKLVNAMAWNLDKISIYIGLYRGAKAGEIAIVMPHLTPCMSCTVGGQRRQQQATEELASTVDYGVGRLNGEIALGCNIHHLSTAAIRIVLDCLCLTSESASLGGFVTKALERKTNLAMLCMEPDHWIFPEMLKDSPGQLAFQSIWAETASNPLCPICGENEEMRSDPFDQATVSTIDIDKIRKDARYSE